MKGERTLQAFLSDPASYPDPTVTVERRETHVSEVYLTDHWAYKIKKPLTLAFLDYGSLEARHTACRAELELNRRFSRDIYHDLVRITKNSQGSLEFNGAGPVVEYAVRMRRIADEFLMDHRLRHGGFSESDQERLITHLVGCYREAASVNIEPETYWRRLQGLIAENRSSLHELALHMKMDPRPWLALCSRQQLFMRAHRDLLLARVKEGHLIEGHGDLRPEHIVLEERVAMIDGIEFNRDLRTLDIADELSFLAMECAVMGHAASGEGIRHRVLDQLQDHAPSELLAFYESYRALVRAKVRLLKAEHEPEPGRSIILQQVEAFQQRAEQCLRTAARPPVFLVAGLMGSGKTTVASALKQDLGAVHLESDRIRRERGGETQDQVAYGQGRYTEESRLRVYEVMRDRMLKQLEVGMPVILDASFSDARYRNCILEPLQSRNQLHLIILCDCSEATAMARISRRMGSGASPSEARPELHQEQRKKADWNLNGHPVIHVNTESKLEDELEKVYRRLGQLMNGG